MRQAEILDDLRERIALIEGVTAAHDVVAFGVDGIDAMLPRGGLVTGALHEVAGGADLADDACATILLAGILAWMPGPVFWCLRWRDLFAPAPISPGCIPTG